VWQSLSASPSREAPCSRGPRAGFHVARSGVQRRALHRTALHRTAPHCTAPHRTALARRLPFTAALVLVLLGAGVATRAMWTPAA
jgi:hypothetical protein